MSRVDDILAVVGLSVGQNINIEGSIRNPFYFDSRLVLIDCNGLIAYTTGIDVLNGALTFEKLPWKPKYGDTYHCIDEDGENKCCTWCDTDMSYYRYNSGNCFRTEKEITPEIKQRILTEMKVKYEND